jgi:primosomal protein N' (replication factor Y) (superfamily II helicase)
VSAPPPTVRGVPSIAKVEPLTSARALRGPFDYRLPEALQRVGVGSLLVVPFGRRRVLGVVVDLAEHSEIDPERLAAPLEALEQGVPADLVRLAAWMARAYCSTPARALGLVLPPGVGPGGERPRVRTKRRLVAELAGRADGRLTEGQHAVLRALAAGPVPAADLPLDHGGLRRLADRGIIVL